MGKPPVEQTDGFMCLENRWILQLPSTLAVMTAISQPFYCLLAIYPSLKIHLS